MSWRFNAGVVLPGLLAAWRDLDPFICRREGRGSELPERDGNWTELRALPAPVNSPKLDFAPAIDASGTTLYFTSERPGIVPAPPDSVRPPGDIYRIPLRDAGIDCS